MFGEYGAFEELFSDSSVNEFRWGTSRTSFHTFWVVTDLNQVANLINFTLMERTKEEVALILSCFKLIQTS